MPAAAVIGGLTTISVVRIAPGVVERRSPFQVVVVGELNGQASERVDRIVEAFRSAGVEARASDRIELELWQKFVFLAALAAACGLARTSVGPLRADPLGRRLLQRAVEEIVAVARARGIGLPANEVARVMGLIDGLPVFPFPLPQTAIIDGDCLSLTIAAASVIAKVTRDQIMRDFCATFPEYCFSQHKGYSTELHLTKLHEFGPCPIHRRSFEPVAQPLLALE